MRYNANRKLSTICPHENRLQMPDRIVPCVCRNAEVAQETKVGKMLLSVVHDRWYREHYRTIVPSEAKSHNSDHPVWQGVDGHARKVDDQELIGTWRTGSQRQVPRGP